MKSTVVCLSLVVTVLAFTLWKRSASAGAAESAQAAALTILSNKLAEANMKVTHQEQLAAAAQASLAERSRGTAALSNAVAALKSDLVKSRVDNKASQAQVRALRDRVAAAETESTRVAGKLEELTAQVQSLNAQLQKASSNESQLESARAALANETECLKIEKVELARLLNDPHALSLRLLALRKGFQPLQLRTNGSVAVSARLQQALRESSPKNLR